MKTLLIAIVAHRPVVDFRLMDSLMGAIPNLMNMGWRPYFASVVGHSDLAGSRNRLFAQGYVGKYDKMLCVDTDMSWEPGTIERLVSHSVDLVGAGYRQKMSEERYTVRTLKGPKRFVDPTSGEDHPFGLLEVAGLATGLLCISKECMQGIVKAHDDLWYEDPVVEGGRAWNVFEFSVQNNERFGEDLHFCRLWRDLGGRAWVDPFLIVHHHGDATYSGIFADHLEKMGELDEGFVELLKSARANLPQMPNAA